MEVNRRANPVYMSLDNVDCRGNSAPVPITQPVHHSADDVLVMRGGRGEGIAFGAVGGRSAYTVSVTGGQMRWRRGGGDNASRVCVTRIGSLPGARAGVSLHH